MTEQEQTPHEAESSGGQQDQGQQQEQPPPDLPNRPKYGTRGVPPPDERD